MEILERCEIGLGSGLCVWWLGGTKSKSISVRRRRKINWLASIRWQKKKKKLPPSRERVCVCMAVNRPQWREGKEERSGTEITSRWKKSDENEATHTLGETIQFQLFKSREFWARSYSLNSPQRFPSLESGSGSLCPRASLSPLSPVAKHLSPARV